MNIDFSKVSIDISKYGEHTTEAKVQFYTDLTALLLYGKKNGWTHDILTEMFFDGDLDLGTVINDIQRNIVKKKN